MSKATSRKRLSLVKMSRWREYNTTKVPLIFVPALYLMSVKPGPPIENYVRLGCIVAFTALYLAFGYMLNDYADREVDRQAGKVNIIGEVPRPLAWFFLLFVFMSGMMTLLPFYSHSLVIWFAILAYTTAAAYSLYPVRLKERGFLGLLVSAIAQRVLPALVLFAVYSHWSINTTALLTLYAMIGFRWILIHQILDESNDRRANVRTFVTKSGAHSAGRFLRRGVFPIEVCAGMVTIALTAITSLGGLLALLVYLGEIGLRLKLHYQRKVPFSLTQFSDIPLAVFYLLTWPILLALSVCSRNLRLIGVLVLIVVWQWGYLRSEGVRFLRLVSLIWRRAPS